MVSTTAAAPRRRPEQARSRAKFDALLDAAAQLLAEQGAEPITMTEIAQRAGVALTAVYWYFPNKVAVLSELAIRTNDQDNQALIDPVGDTNDAPETVIRHIISGYWKLHREEPWRMALRAAVQTNAELATVYLQDRRFTTPVLAAHLAERTGCTNIQLIERRVLLVTELIDAAVRSTSDLDLAEAEAVIEDFTLMAIHLLTSIDQPGTPK